MRTLSAQLFLIVWFGFGVAGCGAVSSGVHKGSHAGPAGSTGSLANGAGMVSFVAFGDAGYVGRDSCQTNVADAMQLSADGVLRRQGGKRPGGWKDALPQTPAEENQLAWFKSAIAESSAPWKLVLAHHPLWESRGSKFAQAEALRGLLLPTLCAYADVWFAGHQHTLEVHEVSCPAPGQGLRQGLALDTDREAGALPRPLLHASIENDGLQLRVLGAPASAQSPDDLTQLFARGFGNRGVAR